MRHRLLERLRAHGLICSLALLLHRAMRPKLADHSPSAALRQLKALQLHRLSAGGKSVRGISTAGDETRASSSNWTSPCPSLTASEAGKAWWSGNSTLTGPIKSDT